MTTKDKILIIATEFPPNTGGIGNHSYNLAKSLADEGYVVSVLCDVINVSKKQLADFSKKENFRIYWIVRSRVGFITYARRISGALVHALRAQTIICSGKFSLWLSILIKINNSTKNLIAVVHGSELDLKGFWAKKITTIALNKFCKIISVSSYTHKHLPGHLKRSIKNYIIPNGITQNDFVNLTAGHLLKGDPALITVGSVTKRKGQENVLTALTSIKLVFPDVHYHMIGKLVNKERIDTLAKERGLSQKISFYGAVSRNKLLKLLSSAKIKLMLSNHTSSGEFEGFGIAVLEANAFGIPVVGSRNSGIADAIDHGRTGLLVNPSRPEEITAAIQKICDEYPIFSENAKVWALKHDWKKIVKRYIDVIGD